MADEPHAKGNPTEDAMWFLAILAGLVILWYFAGGPGQADLRGLFLAPPEPLGNGQAYGPQLGNEASSTATTTPEEEKVAPPPPLDAPTN